MDLRAPFVGFAALICLLFPVLASGQESVPSLRSEFESIYNAWSGAMAKGDYESWKLVTSAYRQAAIRNAIVSQKDPFPQSLFAEALHAPDLAPLKLIDILVKGDTARAIYFGKVDFGIAEPGSIPDNLLVLNFLRESGKWKYDNLRLVRIGTDPTILTQIMKGNREFLQDPQFAPTGIVPPLPPLVNPPAYIAELWIDAIGYDTTVKVNTTHHSQATNTGVRDLINGGLVGGQNGILVETTRLPLPEGATERRLEIAIYATKAKDQPAKRLFHYKPDPDSVEATYQSGIMVSP